MYSREYEMLRCNQENCRFNVLHFLHNLFFTFFQVVIEGVWGNNRVSGYIAVDDVALYEGDCDSELEKTPLVYFLKLLFLLG